MDFLSQDNDSLSCLNLTLPRNSCQLKSREVSEELGGSKMNKLWEVFFARVCRESESEREKERENARTQERSRIVYVVVSHYHSMLNMMR